MIAIAKSFAQLSATPTIRAAEMGRTLARCQLNDGCRIPLDSLRQTVFRRAKEMQKQGITPAMVMDSDGYIVAAAMAPGASWRLSG